MKVLEANAAKEFASTFLADPILKMAVNAVLDNAPGFDLVRCKNCEYRGNPDTCPMCHEEQIEWDDDGYTEVDFVLHDSTSDEGFCECGERRTEGQ